MHTPHPSKLLLVALLSSATAAWAGPLGLGVGASATAGAGMNGIATATGAGAALRAPVFSGSASVGAVNAGATGAGAASSSASLGLARSGAALAASSNGVVFPDVIVDKAEYETIGMRAERVNTIAETAESARARTTTATAKTAARTDRALTSEAANQSQSSARFVAADEIRAASIDRRSRVTGSVAASMADDAKLVARAKRQEKSWNDAQRAEFKAAAADMDAKAKIVKKDMKAADKASEQTWGDARARLATDYAAYTAAAERAHAVASANMTADANANANASAAKAHPATAKAAAEAQANAASQARL